MSDKLSDQQLQLQNQNQLQNLPLQKENQASFLHVPQSSGSYEFHIRDFELLPHNINQKYSSSSFTICGEDKWDIIIIPGGIDNDVSKLVTIGLRNLYSKEIRASCSIFISAGKSGLKFVASTDPGQSYSAYGSDSDTWYTPLPFTFNETLKPGFEFLINGEMIIVVKLNICGDPQFLSPIDIFTDHSISTLSSDLEFLLNQSGSSSNCLKGDITLISGDVRVTCHQCILACRSRIFRESFHTTTSAMKLMLNYGKNVVNKIHPSILREFVRYLYTDECRIEFLMGDQLIYMFHAACRYQVYGLMSICEKRMIDTINVSNAAYYLSVADVVGVKSLIQSCLKFIANHTSDVVATEGYLQLDSHLCRLILGEVTLGSSSTAAGEVDNATNPSSSSDQKSVHVQFSQSEDIVELGSVSRESKLHDEQPVSQMSSLSEDTHEF